MPSPFPGMDPWLERPMMFPGLHNDLIYLLKTAIAARLPAGYAVATANRVWVDVELRREPDVGLFGPPEPPDDLSATTLTTFAGAGLLAVAAEPVSDPIEEPYLEILSGEDDRLVTAIEVVSLANKKAGDKGRVSYQQKQSEYQASGVNLVEIDLLRGGAHTTAVPEDRLRAAAGVFDYHVCITAAESLDRHWVKPVRLMDRLPTIPIPLDPGVTPVPVDLQTTFDRLYDDGGYARLARYDRRRPEPPLTLEQQALAEGILRAKGLLT